MITGNSTTTEGQIDLCDEFLNGAAEREAIKLEICDFIKTIVTKAGAEGVVVAMSGGIDSTLTAALAVEALGSDRVLGLSLPASKTDSSHMSEARTIAGGLGIQFREIRLRPMVGMFEDVVASALSQEHEPVAIGNMTARLRMICTYYAANTQSRLVCGTANRSELLLGYFTKYGDGAADLYPLGDLYKTEVRGLAQHVGLPRRIIEKDPTAGLQAGQTDAADLGATYDVIDPLLQRIVDRGEGVDDVAETLSIDSETATRIAARYVNSLHKRTVPPTPEIGKRSDDRPSYALHLAEHVHHRDTDC